MHLHACAMMVMWRTKNNRSQFSHFILWIPRIELNLSPSSKHLYLLSHPGPGDLDLNSVVVAQALILILVSKLHVYMFNTKKTNIDELCSK